MQKKKKKKKEKYIATFLFGELSRLNFKPLNLYIFFIFHLGDYAVILCCKICSIYLT